MATLTLALAGLLATKTHPPIAVAKDRLSIYVAEASIRFGVPEVWVRRVIRTESGGAMHAPDIPIISRAGARGVMQLMPGTYAEMRRKHGLGSDPDDLKDNVLAGTAYLSEMYQRFGYPGLFAAYNAGPGRFARSLAGEAALPLETLTYVAKLAGPRHRGLARNAAEAFRVAPSPWRTLFALPMVGPNSATGVRAKAAGALFAIGKSGLSAPSAMDAR